MSTPPIFGSGNFATGSSFNGNDTNSLPPKPTATTDDKLLEAAEQTRRVLSHMAFGPGYEDGSEGDSSSLEEDFRGSLPSMPNPVPSNLQQFIRPSPEPLDPLQEEAYEQKVDDEYDPLEPLSGLPSLNPPNWEEILPPPRDDRVVIASYKQQIVTLFEKIRLMKEDEQTDPRILEEETEELGTLIRMYSMYADFNRSMGEDPDAFLSQLEELSRMPTRKRGSK